MVTVSEIGGHGASIGLATEDLMAGVTTLCGRDYISKQETRKRGVEAPTMPSERSLAFKGSSSEGHHTINTNIPNA